jgi:hypothetical protein
LGPKGREAAGIRQRGGRGGGVNCWSKVGPTGQKWVRKRGVRPRPPAPPPPTPAGSLTEAHRLRVTGTENRFKSSLRAARVPHRGRFQSLSMSQTPRLSHRVPLPIAVTANDRRCGHACGYPRCWRVRGGRRHVSVPCDGRLLLRTKHTAPGAGHGSCCRAWLLLQSMAPVAGHGSCCRAWLLLQGMAAETVLLQSMAPVAGHGCCCGAWLLLRSMAAVTEQATKH